jgi:hypothetical protein
VPLVQVGHHVQHCIQVSLPWFSEIYRQQGDFCVQVNPSIFNAPSKHLDQGLVLIGRLCIEQHGIIKLRHIPHNKRSGCRLRHRMLGLVRIYKLLEVLNSFLDILAGNKFPSFTPFGMTTLRSLAPRYTSRSPLLGSGLSLKNCLILSRTVMASWWTTKTTSTYCLFDLVKIVLSQILLLFTPPIT